MEAIIRPAERRDAAAIAAIYAPFVTDTSVSFEIEPPDEAEMTRRMEAIQRSHPYLVAEVDGIVAGYAYGSFHRERFAYQWSAEATVYLAAGYRRQGIARRLYSELFGRLRAMDIRNVFAGVTLPNEASVGFHQSMGFELVGIYKRVGFKCGKWHDTAWYQLVLDSSGDEPRRRII
jgi:phosphinothricin acetyltransferase